MTFDPDVRGDVRGALFDPALFEADPCRELAKFILEWHAQGYYLADLATDHARLSPGQMAVLDLAAEQVRGLVAKIQAQDWRI